MSIETLNQNWASCPRCGQPRLIEPTTGMPELCASFQSRESKGATVSRVFTYVIGVAAVLALLAVFAFGAYLLYHGMLTW